METKKMNACEFYSCKDVNNLYNVKAFNVSVADVVDTELVKTSSDYKGVVSNNIHLIWLGPNIPLFVQTNIVRWAENNPSYNVRVWVEYNEHQLQELFSRFKNIRIYRCKPWLKGFLNNTLEDTEEEFFQKTRPIRPLVEKLSSFLESFDHKEARFAALSDVFRLLFLYAYGGIYADVNDAYFINHKYGETYIIKKLPEPENFVLPFGFMMRMYKALNYRRMNVDSWNNLFHSLYTKINPDIKAHIGDTKCSYNSDFLAGCRYNSVSQKVLEKISKKFDDIKLLFSMAAFKKRSMTDLITEVGPGLICQTIKEFSVSTLGTASYYLYMVFPLPFSEFYFPRGVKCHCTWRESEPDSGPLPRLENELIRSGEWIAQRYRLKQNGQSISEKYACHNIQELYKTNDPSVPGVVIETSAAPPRVNFDVINNRSVSHIIHFVFWRTNMSIIEQTYISGWAKANPGYKIWIWVKNEPTKLKLEAISLLCKYNIQVRLCQSWLNNFNHTIHPKASNLIRRIASELLCDYNKVPSTEIYSIATNTKLKCLFLYLYGGLYVEFDEVRCHNRPPVAVLAHKKLPKPSFFNLPLGFMMRAPEKVESSSGDGKWSTEKHENYDENKFFVAEKQSSLLYFILEKIHELSFAGPYNFMAFIDYYLEYKNLPLAYRYYAMFPLVFTQFYS